MEQTDRKRGFAGMTAAERRIVSEMGGKTAQALGKAHRWTAEQAREAGRKGGQKMAQDRAHMSALGRKGGVAVSRNNGWMREIGRRGGRANALRAAKRRATAGTPRLPAGDAG